jgi:hypothetical protein
VNEVVCLPGLEACSRFFFLEHGISLLSFPTHAVGDVEMFYRTELAGKYPTVFGIRPPDLIPRFVLVRVVELCVMF